MFATIPTKTEPLYVQLKRKLGEGSFGKVYEIKYKGQPAALKIVDKTKLSNPEILKKEVATIQHLMKSFPDCVRNIVCFYEVSEDEDRFYFISELMDKDLVSLIDNNGYKVLNFCKKVDVIYSMANQILEGLDILHKIGIYHRDIKLENFLVGKDKNGKNILKITDFGLSCVIPDCPWSREIGSRDYLHPDILIDPSTKWVAGYDLYAVGIVILVLFHDFLTAEGVVDELEKLLYLRKINEEDVMKHYADIYEDVIPSFYTIYKEQVKNCDPSQIDKFEKLYELIKNLTNPDISRDMEVKDAKAILSS